MIQETRQYLVDHDRLCAAADQLLIAIHSPTNGKSRIPVLTGATRVGGTRPRGIFTLDEYCEAMAMLMRLGVIPKDVSPPTPNARPAQHPRTTP